MNREWLVDLVQRLPQGTVSRAWGWVARRRRPRMAVDVLKRGFVRAVGIDMAEAEEPVGSYDCLQDLFVRKLRPGARRVDAEPSAVVSPVDARVGASGTVDDGTLLQVKGRNYSLARLLGSDDEARRFEGGAFATLYLSPKHYHRIHAPLAGEIHQAVAIPGKLMPVFEEAVENVDELFARNERLITYIDTRRAGRVAVVKVGATLVGRISVTYDEELRTNETHPAQRTKSYEPAKIINKGAELGAFELGSTVILVGEAGRLTLSIASGEEVVMGQRIGDVVSSETRSITQKSSKKKRARKKTPARDGRSSEQSSRSR